MRIAEVKIEGFRLLDDVALTFEPSSTLIVGRNNSGKTSLTDIFDRFCHEFGPKFRLEDFSAKNRSKFFAAKTMHERGESAESIISCLPKISLTLTVLYEQNQNDLSLLAPFIIDLDESCTKAIVQIDYAITASALPELFNYAVDQEGDKNQRKFYRHIRDFMGHGYSIQVRAIDPIDSSNIRKFDSLSQLRTLMQCGFIRAQRTLDHAKHGDPDVIGKLLGVLYKTASVSTAAPSDNELAIALKTSVHSIEQQIQENFDGMLKQLLPALAVFGFPGLNDTELRPETSLNVEALLSDHTKVVYSSCDGVHLPEGYNGLGTRNLIYMLLQLESLHRAYRSMVPRPATHLIFIEEPEAHLHPQMQEVFINQLHESVKALSAKYADEPVWPVQFVVSTHSSHVANAAPFEAIRYFLCVQDDENLNRHTKVKDFKGGLSKISPNDRNFLQQYMTLTKCDLYFADKVVLVEGTTERILMPVFFSILDKNSVSHNKLMRQYISTIEVGGAYAHKFYDLIDFLELKTLIITDIDAVKLGKNSKGTNSWVKCPFSEGKGTSNAAIKFWFEVGKDEGEKTISPDELIAMADSSKVKGFRRIAYQIPEEGLKVCARSYEDALILANLQKFELHESATPDIDAWEEAQKMSKSESALRFAIEDLDWRVPRYISEGLLWLADASTAKVKEILSAESTKESEAIEEAAVAIAKAEASSLEALPKNTDSAGETA